jgi:hypothetical protein
MKLYPSLSGLFNVKLAVSIVYVVGFVCPTGNAHQLKLYLIVYVFASQFASYTLFHIDHCVIVTPVVRFVRSVQLHHMKSYPSLSGLFNVKLAVSTLYPVRFVLHHVKAQPFNI